MIASASLAAWLADRDSQLRSRAAVDAFATRWSLDPLMSRTERALATLPDRSAGAILEIARDFLDQTGEMDRLMREAIAASRQDAFFKPPFLPIINEIYNSLLLFNNPHLLIALGVTGVDVLATRKSGPRGATSVVFTGITTLYRFVKAGEATFSFWEAPPITDDFVASQAGNCRMVDCRRIRDGEEIVVDGRYQSFVIEHAATDMVYFQATVLAEAAPLVVEYDTKSLAFAGASSTDEISSRVQMMVSLLRAMEREDALPLIEEALASKHFYTRWHIMREMLAMDAEAALPSLRRMAANDPHPEVRAASQQTLELFFEDEAEAGPVQGDVQCRA